MGDHPIAGQTCFRRFSVEELIWLDSPSALKFVQSHKEILKSDKVPHSTFQPKRLDHVILTPPSSVKHQVLIITVHIRPTAFPVATLVLHVVLVQLHILKTPVQISTHALPTAEWTT